jgi:hypothetical protein
VGSTLALAQPLYYDRLVQLVSIIKFVHQILAPLPGNRCFVKINFVLRLILSSTSYFNFYNYFIYFVLLYRKIFFLKKLV